jgi:hypothetical protein
MFNERGYHGRGILARELEKHHEAGVTLDVAGHSAVLDLGGPGTDVNRIDDLSPSALGRAAPGLAQLSRCAQAHHQLLLQHAAGLNKETAMDVSCDTCMPWSAGNCCFSQPEICFGDHSSASFCATRHRNPAWRARRQGFGRNARCQACLSAQLA